MGKASKLAVVISTSILLTSCLGLFPEEHRAISIDRYPYPDIPAGYGRLLFHGMSNTVTSETLYCHVSIDGQLVGNPKSLWREFFFVDVPVGIHDIESTWGPNEGVTREVDGPFGRKEVTLKGDREFVTIIEAQTIEVEMTAFPSRCQIVSGKTHGWLEKDYTFLSLPPAPPASAFITYQ